MPDVARTIESYFGECERDAHSRYKSWEHCFAHFAAVGPRTLATAPEAAALHLGFFLASWGMYRGSAFLLQHDYLVHVRAVNCLADDKWNCLRTDECEKPTYVAAVLELYDGLYAAYEGFGKPTETLVTKIMIGTLGCVPAADRYFIRGWCGTGRKYSAVNRQFLNRVHDFATVEAAALTKAKAAALRRTGAVYPRMKLVDMYFHQLGNVGEH